MNQNNGYLMEHLIYEQIKELNLFDEIIYEKDLVKRFGREAVGIDYLLIYQNKMIILQIKWRRTRRRENNAIKNFLNSVNHIINKINDKQYIMGLYISRMEPFSDNKDHLKNNKVHCIYDFNSMTTLAVYTANYLKSLKSIL